MLTIFNLGVGSPGSGASASNSCFHVILWYTYYAVSPVVFWIHKGFDDMENISDLIPRSKFDTSGIERLKVINITEAEPILGDLLEWLQDINWPVAKELFYVLPRFEKNLVPHIRTVFNSDDDIWKNWILCMLKTFSPDTVKLLSYEIKGIANNPTAGELLEETNKYASDIVQIFQL